jgi:hypothetical protein
MRAAWHPTKETSCAQCKELPMQQMNYIILGAVLLALLIIGIVFWSLARASKTICLDLMGSRKQGIVQGSSDLDLFHLFTH